MQTAEFDAKMVMIEQGSRVEIMYPNLFKGLGHKPKDLSKYDVPLVRFDGKTIVLRSMIRLLVQTGEEVVNADFIIVEAYSPYMAILVRPWLHALEVVSLTLHVKLKHPTEGGVGELLGYQAVARQCMVEQSGTKPLKLAPQIQILPIATSARHASLLGFFSIV